MSSVAEHSYGHIDCPACRARSLVRAEDRLADMLFPEAFETWLAARLIPKDSREASVRYIADTSQQTYREYAWALTKFFGRMRLANIHDGHLRTYQDDRANNRGELWQKPCGQNRIRREVALLLRILRVAQVWEDELDDAFDQLPNRDTDVQRVLEPAQQESLLQATQNNPDWRWVHDYIVICLRTCISTIEARTLRLKDIHLDHRTIRVGPEASKNKFRNRTIPLEHDDALAAAARLLRRAREFGAYLPEHYVFPFGGGSRRGDLDVSRPMTKFGLKHTWNLIRQYTGLTWLRPYDLRHTAITNMALAGTPMAVIQAFAGHIGTRMQQHYTTISLQAKRAAAQQEAEFRKKPPARAVEYFPEKNYLTN